MLGSVSIVPRLCLSPGEVPPQTSLWGVRSVGGSCRSTEKR